VPPNARKYSPRGIVHENNCVCGILLQAINHLFNGQLRCAVWHSLPPFTLLDAEQNPKGRNRKQSLGPLAIRDSQRAGSCAYVEHGGTRNGCTGTQ
jgi:hypothetical protein